MRRRLFSDNEATTDHVDSPAERERRAELAKSGQYFPNNEDLLLGSPFFRGRLQSDIATFCERLLQRRRDDYDERIVKLLEPLAVEDIWPREPEISELIEQVTQMRSSSYSVDERTNFHALQPIILRFKIYHLFVSCGGPYLPDILAELQRMCRRNVSSRRSWLALRQIVGLGLIVGSPGAVFSDPEQAGEKSDETMRSSLTEIVQMLMGQKTEQQAPDVVASPEEAAVDSEGDGIIVLRDIGSKDTDHGRRVLSSWKDMIGAAIPLARVPDLAAVRDRLRFRFPHAHRLIDTLLSDMAVRSEIMMRPLILSGPAGCGKTEFAMQLMEALDLPATLFNCGGVHDAGIGGSSRHWATGQPSLPADQIRKHRIANPAIILDEIEKAGTGHHNGNLLDVLLGLLEPGSAREYHDSYLLGPIDLSHIIWIATSNDVSRLPSPLRDRCRIHAFPVPASEHLPGLAASCLDQIRVARRLDRSWCPELAPDELEALAGVWQGGSIRKLRRLVEGVVQARELAAGVQ